MTGRHITKVLNLAALKPARNEMDTAVRNYDGTIINVREAPLIRALAKGLGVIFNIVIPEEGVHGVKKPDGTWDGIMGLLLSGKADLSGRLFTATKERREVVNFTYPLQVTDITFMTDKPEASPKSFAIFDAFSTEVWVSTLLCVLLTSLLLYILLKRKETYSTILFETIGCLLEKSFSFEARQSNTTILLLFWLLGITVLTNSYKAIILSVITVPRMVGIHDIMGLAKAAKENSVMCMTYKGNAMWQVELNDDRLKEIGECLKRGEDESLDSHSAFLNYAHKKAFISDGLDLTEYSREYLISEDSFSLMHAALAYSKQFCCPKKLNDVVHRIFAADLVPKIIRDRCFLKHLRQSKTKSQDHDSNEWKPLTLKDFTGAFLVLILGHFLALVVFMMELISKHLSTLNLY